MRNVRRLACAVSAAWLTAPAPGPGVQAADEAGEAAKLLVVDCLLPGQVRKLGTTMTFLTARRPVKTSAQECEIRGGEYTAYDRSDHASAIKVWMPGAQEGDKVAQTYVGEIFEKGFGTTPDYVAAASWYSKAAAQGYARAQINLGFLYEKGLGVPRDPVAALRLYRQASGMPEAIALDDGTSTAASAAAAAGSERELKALRQELEETRRQLDKARGELERQRSSSQAEAERLEAQRRKAVEAGNAVEVGRLEALLRQREDDLARRSREIALLEQQMSGYRSQLAGLQTESAGLRAQLDQVREQLAGSQQELADRRAQIADAQKRLEQARGEFERQKQAASSAGQAEAARLAARLRQRETELAHRTQDLARIEAEAQRYRAELAKLEQQARAAPAPAPAPAAASVQVAMAPPSIQLIDPPVMLTRGPTTVQVRGSVATREVVGRVTAPAGLLAFTVNDRSETSAVDANGLFRVGVALAGRATPVTLVAVDRQGKRSVAEFSLVSEGVATVAAPPAAPAIPRLNFGSYHALVIGNQNYRQLPRLETAVTDAKAVADVLTKKYGFRTTTLVDATRYQILSELNRLRTKLTENDNLLIYYAGHGELDKANLRGHWLPVDAEPGSDANWISSVAITDILNAMTVRHVLVVADSCYSGALTRTSIGQLEAGRSEEERTNWLKALTKMRSRVVLTSGGLQPVLDGGGGDHSLFAKYFLEVLAANSDVIEARRVYQELAARVLNTGLRYRVEQVPQYAPIQFAGHESGDFLFVPATRN